MDFQANRSALVWLTMAGFCGLFGFILVYHYVSHGRQLQHFAIVIDAGSTQTRSGLFSIEFDTPQLTKLMDEQLELGDSSGAIDSKRALPLTQLLRVRQIGSCINGGPLASIGDEREAEELLTKCFNKFTQHIKQLNFPQNDDEDEEEDNGAETNGPERLTRKLNLVNRRVNSVTHLYLGATAGMRALQKLNHTKSDQIMQWLEAAIGTSNRLLSFGGPYVNRAFVDVITGQQEATFGWISVNFLAEKLLLEQDIDNSIERPLATNQNSHIDTHSKQAIYHYENDQMEWTKENNKSHIMVMASNSESAPTIGTLELGGASAQMAFQLTQQNLMHYDLNNNGQDGRHFETNELQLFGRKFHLATRSDLCLGMSQAVARVQDILLRQHMRKASIGHLGPIEVSNVCMQNGTSVKLLRGDLFKLQGGACLMPSAVSNSSTHQMKIETLPERVTFKGLGDWEQCDKLLETLVEPQLCAQHFQLCPQNKAATSPSLDHGSALLDNTRIPFVTISGYNHALSVLNLKATTLNSMTQLDTTIGDKLGGQPVDQKLLVAETQKFCRTNAKDLAKLYPNAKEPYRAIVCLQLVYINKLLTQFYGFNSQSTWNRLRFLLFESTVIKDTHQQMDNSYRPDPKRDIGWTLGMLLNATSYQLSSPQILNNAIFFHHRSTVAFIMRSTLLLMLACFLIAIALLVVGVVEVRQAQRRASAYISHQPDGFASPYHATGSYSFREFVGIN